MSSHTKSESSDLNAALRLRIHALLRLTDGESVRLPLGGHLFDVVVTAASAWRLITTLDNLPGGCGPVIHDPTDGGWLYWITPAGTASTWKQHPHAVCLGAGTHLTVPPPTRVEPPGPYWIRPFTDDYVNPVALTTWLNDLPSAQAAPPRLDGLARHLTNRH